MDYFETVEKRLDLPKAEKEQVLRELRSHCAEIVVELRESGSDAARAEAEAERRVGDPVEIARRLSSAHNKASWKTTMVASFACLMPFAGMLTLMESRVREIHMLCRVLLVGSPLFVLTAVLLAGSIRCLRSGTRPAWLPGWLAFGLVGVFYSSMLLTQRTLDTWVMAAPLHMVDRMHLVGALPQFSLLVVVAGIFVLVYGRRGAIGLALSLGIAWFWWNGFWSSMITPASLLLMTLMIAIAIRVFARDARSRPSDATLFLVLMLVGPFVEIPGRQTAESAPFLAAYLAGFSLILGLAIVLYARVGSSTGKMLCLAGWICCCATINGTAARCDSGDWASLVSQIVVTTLVLSLFAFVLPWLAARWRLRFQMAVVPRD